MRQYRFMPDMGSFAEGTRIATTQGEIPVEEIKVGTRLMTPDGENATVIEVKSRKVRFAPKSLWRKPILVPAGALGGGLPTREIMLPPGQLVGLADLSPVDMFGRADVLVPAIALRRLPGARIMKGRRRATLFSVFTAEPTLIYAEGTVTETTRPLASRVAAMLSGGRLGCDVHKRAGIRILGHSQARRLVAQLRSNGDLPDHPPAKREQDMAQWDQDLEMELSETDRRTRKAG